MPTRNSRMLSSESAADEDILPPTVTNQKRVKKFGLLNICCAPVAEDDVEPVHWMPNLEQRMPMTFLNDVIGNQLQDLDVIMHPGCFYSTALRTVLLAYGIKHTNHEIRMFNSMGNMCVKQDVIEKVMSLTGKNSNYFKCPIVVANKAYQVNDSMIIAAQLAPIITGSSLSPKHFDTLMYINREVIPRLITFTFLEADECAAFVENYFGDRKLSKVMIRNVGLPGLGRRSLKEVDKDPSDLKLLTDKQLTYMQKSLMNKLSLTGGKFFGGVLPNVVDYYLLGALHTAVSAKCRFSRRLLNSSKLGGWYNSTRKSLPETLFNR